MNLECSSFGHLPLQHPDTFDALLVPQEELDRSAGEESGSHEDEGDYEGSPDKTATAGASLHFVSRILRVFRLAHGAANGLIQPLESKLSEMLIQ